MPSATRARDTGVPVRRFANKRGLDDDSEEADERGMHDVEEDEIGLKDLKRKEENLAPIDFKRNSANRSDCALG